MKILLADRQDITRAGLMHIIDSIDGLGYKYVEDKAELMEALKQQSLAEAAPVVVLDYTLFDINDADELLILCQRFRNTRWLLFSDELSTDFVCLLIASSPMIGIVLKDASLAEIRDALRYAVRGQRYICQRVAEMLIMHEQKNEEKAILTKTETEILKDIALGMTTREIADKRFSSFHTVNTHRKNIFRKLGVNNVHEATKYALRAGLVDSAEYYI